MDWLHQDSTMDWFHQAPLSMGFPSNNNGMGCHFLFQGTFRIQGSNLPLLHWRVDSLTLDYQGSQIFEYSPPICEYTSNLHAKRRHGKVGWPPSALRLSQHLPGVPSPSCSLPPSTLPSVGRTPRPRGRGPSSNHTMLSLGHLKDSTSQSLCWRGGTRQTHAGTPAG